MIETMRLNVPLNALRAFEAAARHMSIKDAAGELGVTSSAVSHQLRVLEDALGVDLLRRAGPRMELTETGRRLAPELTVGFGHIAGAVGTLKADRKTGPLRLSMLPTFATHWFSPRLASYPFSRRGFELLISTTQVAVDLAAGVADAGVRYGRGGWPKLLADRLFDEDVMLYGSPGFARQDEKSVREAVSGANLFLSQYRQENFERWNASLPDGPVCPGAITIVDSAGLGLKAAIDGAGITFGGCEMAAHEVAAGRLVPLFAHRIPSGGSYFLVYPPTLERDTRIRNVRNWMLEEAAKAGARTPSSLV